ncbi:uncharacterized protein METZ01_LOCUS509574, partial [marine metagenome]
VNFPKLFVASAPLILASGYERVRYIGMNMLPKDSLVLRKNLVEKLSILLDIIISGPSQNSTW